MSGDLARTMSRQQKPPRSPSLNEAELFDIPDMRVFLEANVYDSDGQTVQVASLFQESSVLVLILIRHFNCGSCQKFLEAMSAINPDKWHKYSANVVVVGVGESNRIDAYNNLTHCPFEIYSDPKRDLHKKLNLGDTSCQISMEDPKYHKRGTMGDIFSGIRNGIKMGIFTGAGSVSQLGGDYVFRTDALGNTVCTFARKQPNTRSHTEPEVLYNEAKKAYAGLRSSPYIGQGPTM